MLQEDWPRHLGSVGHRQLRLKDPRLVLSSLLLWAGGQWAERSGLQIDDERIANEWLALPDHSLSTGLLVDLRGALLSTVAPPLCLDEDGSCFCGDEEAQPDRIREECVCRCTRCLGRTNL